ncbi:holin [Herbiconiux moechotypicola]|uniref:Holin n=1 Tax=Herbiconiux moechotypicola TaxID=637393 RepID=A0ABN3DG85_9MICO|nr:holin [Herbiconiux moechotypicola]MCS5729502.1 holin [Herbiconiux moechotypicola]
MKKYFTIAFVDYAGERALKTAVQSLFAGGLIGAGLFDLDWTAIGSLAGGIAVASVLTSFLFYKGDGSDNPDDTSTGARHAA